MPESNVPNTANQPSEEQEERPLVAFISGPLDPSSAYFTTHYLPPLLTAIQARHHFLIGPVSGIDALALAFLLACHVPPSHISIYVASFEYAIPTLRHEFESKGVKVVDTGAQTTRERDACMTRDSDYDILRYRTEAEAKEVYGGRWRERVSNTEMNERRRRGDFGQEYRGGWVGRGPGEGGGEGERGESGGGEEGMGEGGKKPWRCLVEKTTGWARK